MNTDLNTAWSEYNLGEAFVKQGKWDEAIAAYQHVLELNSDLPFIHRKLGNALQQKSNADREAALKFYLKIILQNPNEVQNYHKAIELQPNNAKLYLGLGNALTHRGELDEAIYAYLIALQLQPDDRETSLKLEEISKKITGRSLLDRSGRVLDHLNQIALDRFLLTNSQIYFPEVEHPEVSIILVLSDRAELNLSCLYSIFKNNFKSLEVIFVANNYSEINKLIFKQIKNVKIISAFDKAVQVAKGNYLLFLNSRTQVLGNSINSAVETIKSSEDIGAVGGKILLANGVLQEAGGIIWQNGFCLGYGTGNYPTEPQYMFRRSVDYCSKTFLLTNRKLFLELGGFDKAYNSDYYDDIDYSVRLLKSGKKIIYDPNIAVLRYREIELQRRNRKLFLEKHQDWLQFQYPQNIKNVLFARTSRDNRKRILFIDDKVPHPFMGSGYTRAYKILDAMVSLKYAVTFYPIDISFLENWKDIYSDISQEIEIMIGYGLPKLEKFLRERKEYYEIIFVSRPHNMQYFNNLVSKDFFEGKTEIIYDAEALYCFREFERQILQGEKLSPEWRQKLISEELSLGKNSDRIVSVSENERQKFLEYGYQKISVLGHSLTVSPTPNGFEERKHILFVGAVYDIISPNADSIIWFSKEIFKLIQAKLGQDIDLLIAGNNTVEELKQQVRQLGNESMKILGRVDDLSDLYNQSLVFVAPTRFAAGIPHKVHEAAARGIPVVTTSLIATQLGWNNEFDLLVADSAQEFAEQCVRLYGDKLLWNRIRNNALKRVKKECSPEHFTKILSQILDTTNSSFH